MLVEEIIQRVQSAYSKGVQSDDSRLKVRHIYNKMTSVRSLLISQKISKKQKISDWSYQVLECVPLTKVPIYDCPCVPAIGCSVYRTVEKIPKPIMDLNTELIKSVMSIDGYIHFSRSSWEAQKYKDANKYLSESPDYFIKNGYLYIYTRQVPELITIIGLFEDPLAAFNFTSYCTGTPDCLSPLEREFSMDADDIESLIKLCTEELVDDFNKRVEDLRNDTKDNTFQDTK